jgi:hypothetical protein
MKQIGMQARRVEQLIQIHSLVCEGAAELAQRP